MMRSQDQIQGGEPVLVLDQLSPGVEVLASKDREMRFQGDAVLPHTECDGDAQVCTTLPQVMGSHNVKAREDVIGSGQEQLIPNGMKAEYKKELDCLSMDSLLRPRIDAVASSVGSISSRAGERKGSQTGQAPPKVILKSPRDGLFGSRFFSQMGSGRRKSRKKRNKCLHRKGIAVKDKRSSQQGERAK